MRTLSLVAAACLLASTAGADELLPLQPGMAVVTLKASTPACVVRILDIRGPECAPAAHVGQDWPCPRDANELPNPTNRAEDEWTVYNLGEVFGIALDDAPTPNIYVTATHCYRSSGPSSGVVHRLDGTTGAISVFAVLPNESQAGLGNICFDPVNRQFFVSNMEDGLITRLGLDGSVLSTFDPFLPDDGLPGFPPLGDRAWGLAFFQDRLYFGTWSEDQTRRLNDANGVWSVAIDECGEFSGVERLELTLKNIPARTFTEPVADIAFSSDGHMLVSERTMESDTSSDAHNARTLEFTWDGIEWQESPRIYQVGGGTDAGGGVDYAECPAETCAAAQPHVLGTGDRLTGNGAGAVHGLQIFPLGGGTPDESYLIDFSPGKRGIGDVEYVRPTTCRISPAACATTASVAATMPTCRGVPAILDASVSAAVRCCGALEYRFEDPTGLVARDWSGDAVLSTMIEGDWLVDVRCSVDLGCAAEGVVTVDLGDNLPGAPLVDLEQTGTPDCTRPGSIFHVVPGSFGPCSAPAYQWYEDGSAISGATADSYVIPDTVPEGVHEYHVVVSCPEGLPCGDTSAPLTITLSDFANGPVLSLEETPPVGCARPVRILRVVPGSYGACRTPGFTWHQDGAVIAGATADSYEIPASQASGTYDYDVVVSCPVPLLCGDTSAPVTVTLEDLPTPPAVALDETPPVGCAQPLRILRVVPDSFGTCSVPEYQWMNGSAPIVGATGDSYVVPDSTSPGTHDYVVVVTCPEGLPCGDTSSPVTVVFTPLPGAPRVSAEQRPSGVCSRDVVVLRLAPDSFGPCSLPAYQWFEDGVAIPGATADTYQVADTTPAGPHDYVVQVTCPEALPCGDTSAPVNIVVRDPPPGPAASIDVVAGGPCLQERITVSAVPGSFGDCSFPEYQWYQDGVPIPGAIDASYVIPGDTPAGIYVLSYTVTCPEPLPCGDTSPGQRVTVTDFTSGVLNRNIDGWLYVTKDVGTRLHIVWDDRGVEATAYNLYEGAIDVWYSHAQMSCALPRVPVGAVRQSTVVAPRGGNSYYLLSSADCRGEGLVGTDSFRRARPIVGIGAACGAAP